MPIMDGLEASKRIRLISDTIPIIAVTAADLRANTLKIEFGIDYLVNKPVDIYKLKILLNDLL
jgi:CheY-like chemotaxis protein